MHLATILYLPKYFDLAALVDPHNCSGKNVAPTVVGTYSRPRSGAYLAVRIMGSTRAKRCDRRERVLLGCD